MNIPMVVLVMSLAGVTSEAAEARASGDQQTSARCKELVVLRDTRLFEDSTRIQDTIAKLNEAVADLKALQQVTEQNKSDFRLKAHADMLLRDLIVVINVLKFFYSIDLGDLEGRPGLTTAYVAELIASRAIVRPLSIQAVAKSKDDAEIALALGQYLPRKIGSGIALYNSVVALVREGNTLEIDWASLKSTTSQLAKQLDETSRRLQSARFKQLFLQKLKEKIDAECGSKNAQMPNEEKKSAEMSFPSFVTPGKAAPAVKSAGEKKDDGECAVLSDKRGVELAVADIDKFEQLKNRCKKGE